MTSKIIHIGLLIMAITISFITTSENAFADTTGATSPTVVSTDPDIDDFSSEANAFSSNNVYATGTNNADQAYGAFGFDLSIPTGSVINGITVSLEGHQNTGISSCGSVVGDPQFSVRLSNPTLIGVPTSATSFTGDIKTTTDYGSGDSTKTLGSSSDTWSNTYTNLDNFWILVISECGTLGSSMALDHVTVEVEYSDITPPVITLLGTNLQIINLTNPYIEQGATALDDVDGNITANIVTNSSAVNTSTDGAYLVTYDVMDSAGNPAVQVVRTVIVLDNIIPVIALNGDAEIDIPYGVPYVDQGATAFDIDDGNLTSSIITVNPVDVFQGLTTFFVTYDVSDLSGNPAVQVVRSVNVLQKPSNDSCNNCQQPSIGMTDRGQRVVDDGITVNGQTMDADFYFTPFPLIQSDMNEQITMHFVIWDDRRDNIAHVEVGFGKGKIGESFGKLESSVIWNRHVMSKVETITFDETAFKDVSMKMLGKTNCKNASNDNSCDLFKVQFTPIKAIVGDVVFGISIWDDNRNAMTTFFNEGLQVGTEADVIPEVEFVPPEGNGNRPVKVDEGLGDVDNRNSKAFKMKYDWHTEQMELIAKKYGY